MARLGPQVIIRTIYLFLITIKYLRIGNVDIFLICWTRKIE